MRSVTEQHVVFRPPFPLHGCLTFECFLKCDATHDGHFLFLSMFLLAARIMDGTQHYKNKQRLSTISVRKKQEGARVTGDLRTTVVNLGQYRKWEIKITVEADRKT